MPSKPFFVFVAEDDLDALQTTQTRLERQFPEVTFYGMSTPEGARQAVKKMIATHNQLPHLIVADVGSDLAVGLYQEIQKQQSSSTTPYDPPLSARDFYITSQAPHFLRIGAYEQYKGLPPLMQNAALGLKFFHHIDLFETITEALRQKGFTPSPTPVTPQPPREERGQRGPSLIKRWLREETALEEALSQKSPERLSSACLAVGSRVSGPIAFSAQSAYQAYTQGKLAVLVVDALDEKRHGAILPYVAGLVVGHTQDDGHLPIFLENMGVSSLLDTDDLAKLKRLPEGVTVTLDPLSKSAFYGKPAFLSAPYAALAEFSQLEPLRQKLLISTEGRRFQEKLPVDLGAKPVGLARTENMRFGLYAEAFRVDLFNALAGGQGAFEGTFQRAQEDCLTRLFKPMVEKGISRHCVRLLDAGNFVFLPKEQQQAIFDVLIDPHADRPELPAGVQLAKRFPSLYLAQLTAIFNAAQKSGLAHIEILVPQVKTVDDISFVHGLIDDLPKGVTSPVPFSLGTMIETPEALSHTAQLAKVADFGAFGCNDLTLAHTALPRTAAPRRAFMAAHGYDPYKKLPPDLLAKIKGSLANLPNGYDTRLCGEFAATPNGLLFAHETPAIGASVVAPSQNSAAAVLIAREIAHHQRKGQMPDKTSDPLGMLRRLLKTTLRR